MRKIDPINFKLIDTSSGMVTGLSETTSTDIFTSPGSSEFHPDGLFSTRIFGRLDTPQRNKNFAKVKVKAPILHPHIYNLLKTTKAFYIDILHGAAYAKWDEKKKDFVKADALDGQTGYAFFMSHWPELKIEPGESKKRKQRVAAIDKYRKEAVVENIMILPAGLRDVEIAEDGTVSEDEINALYRKLINIVRNFNNISGIPGDVYDKTRVSLQKTFNEVYETLKTRLTGKNGFILDVWASRNVQYGTRNVISSMNTAIESIYDASIPDINATATSLWQVAAGSLPLTVFKIKEYLINRLNLTDSESHHLTDYQTLESEYVTMKSRDRDRWLTDEGIEKSVKTLSNVELRDKPILIDGRFAVGFIDINNGSLKVYPNLTEVDDKAILSRVRPITNYDLVYLAIADIEKDLAGIITRYPVSGEGSVYPTKIMIKTQVRVLKLVDEDTGQEYSQFPIYDKDNAYLESLQVHPMRLAGLGGDFDGDMVTLNILYGKKAVSEIFKYFDSVNSYVHPSGGVRARIGTLMTTLTMHNLTGEPRS